VIVLLYIIAVVSRAKCQCLVHPHRKKRKKNIFRRFYIIIIFGLVSQVSSAWWWFLFQGVCQNNREILMVLVDQSTLPREYSNQHQPPRIDRPRSFAHHNSSLNGAFLFSLINNYKSVHLTHPAMTYF
jgi:hypothetical protein